MLFGKSYQWYLLFQLRICAIIFILHLVNLFEKLSLVFRKRWELIFLVKHSKRPKMSVESAAKFPNKSRGLAHTILNAYESSATSIFLTRGHQRESRQKSKIVRLSNFPRLSNHWRHSRLRTSWQLKGYQSIEYK